MNIRKVLKAFSPAERRLIINRSALNDEDYKLAEMAVIQEKSRDFTCTKLSFSTGTYHNKLNPILSKIERTITFKLFNS